MNEIETMADNNNDKPIVKEHFKEAVFKEVRRLLMSEGEMASLNTIAERVGYPGDASDLKPYAKLALDLELKAVQAMVQRITYNTVADVANSLHNSGVVPTLNVVKAAIGHGGSSTIHGHLKAWAEETGNSITVLTMLKDEDAEAFDILDKMQANGQSIGAKPLSKALDNGNMRKMKKIVNAWCRKQISEIVATTGETPTIDSMSALLNRKLSQKAEIENMMKLISEVQQEKS